MRGALLTMSTKEVNRLETIQLVAKKHIKQKEAAKQLNVSVRQVRRLLKAYRQSGGSGLVSKHRGKVSNRAHLREHKERIIAQVRQHYADFGPTLAAEKLLERDSLSINKETLRQWMIEAGLWQSKRRKAVVVHQQRARRSCEGELVQIDGSPHDWFEGRAPNCCLLVFIDDATGKLMELHFTDVECAQGYFEITRHYIEKQGRPVSLYSDKHGIFRVNIPEARSGTGETQYGRVLRELGIELICANSPQAKGRVEKANHTLQDRLVKELRLSNINSIEEANAFLPIFIEQYNKKFAIVPANPINVHRTELPEKSILDLIFTTQHDRKLSKNLELSYNNIIYQIQIDTPGYAMRHASVKVCEDASGKVILRYKGNSLTYKTFDKKNQPTQITDAKQLGKAIKKSRAQYQPAADHPWRNYEKNNLRKKAA